jgi:hypothetical protein
VYNLDEKRTLIKLQNRGKGGGGRQGEGKENITEQRQSSSVLSPHLDGHNGASFSHTRPFIAQQSNPKLKNR